MHAGCKRTERIVICRKAFDVIRKKAAMAGLIEHMRHRPLYALAYVSSCAQGELKLVTNTCRVCHWIKSAGFYFADYMFGLWEEMGAA